MKKIVSLVLCGVLMLSIVGCSKNNTKEEQSSTNNVSEESEDIQVSNKLDEFKKELKNQSLDVSDNKEFVYEDLGASLAYKFDVSGSSIEIYYYDKDNLFEGADKVIEEAKNGAITRDDTKINVIYNNYYMLIGTDTNKDAAEIIEVFNNLFK